MYKTFFSLLIFLILSILVLLFAAPFIDHLFYVGHRLEDIEEYEIFIMIITHIILLGILVYIFHKYLVKNYMKHFKLSRIFIKIMDLILALTLTGLQRNLIIKIGYLSNKHPIRNELIV
uniref:Uncharacterized protein n=1 Tax=viral metagenome TaxID=1070528 RepID=A0A6C0C879_9ZZZZ